MACPRFFIEGPVPTAEDMAVPLAAEELHHLTDVLRVRPGERVVLVEPGGAARLVEVVGVSGRGLFVRCLESLARPWDPHVTLILGVAKGGKVDEAVQGAVEVGVEAVQPVSFARDVVKLDPRKRAQKTERWRRVAAAAAKQAQRSRVPEVREPLSFDALVGALGGFDLVLVAWEEACDDTVRDAISAAAIAADSSVAIVVGSEGGLTGAEVARMRNAGARVVTLGPTILRAETAGIVAPALVVAELHALHAAEIARDPGGSA
jgi:16S rRNA (uracil1498-N3)-methyltransferase